MNGETIMDPHNPCQTYKLAFILKDNTFAICIPSSFTPKPGLVLLQSGEEFLSLLKCQICLDSTVSYEGLHCQTKESV